MTDLPNLFDYATSELSQDAFLCWVIAHASFGSTPMGKLARALIATMYSRARPTKPTINVDDVSLAVPPKRQVKHTDIAFVARVGSDNVLFVVEDKTNTGVHSNQAERYRRWAEEETKGGCYREAVMVYVKTGHLFDEDHAMMDMGYAVISLEDLIRILDAVPVVHPIVTEWRERGMRLLDQRKREIERLDPLSSALVQYELVSRIRKRLGVGGEIERGINLGGGAWTQLWFSDRRCALVGDVGEYLFLRVDARNAERKQRRPYLAIRQYAEVSRLKRPEDLRMAREKKLARLSGYRAIFEQVRGATTTPLRFARPAGDNQGANESEIGVLFFDDVNTPVAVIDALPILLRSFLDRSAAQDGSSGNAAHA